MKLFTLTSSTFTGEVIFEFNDSGLLLSFDSKGADLTEGQQVFLLRNMPRELAEVKAMLEKSPNAKFTEFVQEITFDMFWNRYNDKIRSSRKKAETKWKRMSKTNQAKAYYGIAKYENSIPIGVAKKYAESYLNAELWNN